jgi:hypothetical protein
MYLQVVSGTVIFYITQQKMHVCLPQKITQRNQFDQPTKYQTPAKTLHRRDRHKTAAKEAFRIISTSLTV